MSSFFDDASLVMIPSGYKDQKVYSVKPLDGSGDLTFSRASGATRVASNGLIEKVRTNLLLQSNTFSNASWTKTQVSVTSGQAGYDGTTNAWLLNVNAGTSSQNIQQTISSSGLATYSVYLKAGTTDWVALRATGSPVNCLVWFDLSTGTKGSNQNATNYTITSVGSGWYRCTLTTSTTIDNVFIYPATADDLAGLNCVSGDNILIQATQLESGDIATDYIATTSAAVSVGPVSGLPRLDYLWSTCPRLLLEPQRQNVITFSEQMDNAAWSETNVTITANSTVSPDGYTNADTITSNSASAASIFQTKSIASSTTYTASVFVKKDNNESRFPEFTLRTESTSFSEIYVQLNTKTGASTIRFQEGTASKSVESFGDYWRVSLTVTNIGDTQIIFRIAPAATNVFGTFNPQVGSIIAYGAQLEVGAYATSYIPTLGSSVTRVADACSKTGISSLIGQTEGTLFVELADWQLALDTLLFSVSDGSLSNYLQISTNSITGDLQSVIFTGGGGTPLGNTAPTAGQTVKVAVGYKLNDYVLYVNGVQIGTLTSKAAPSALTRTDIGSLGWFTSGLQPRPKFAQALLFKTRLTNAQLAELTTL